MEIKFTNDQQKVIDVRGKNVLVAAAAGSGKTAVLVERIIQMITDEKNPVDVDRILVVTFTKAAAAQMRGRIYDAIEAALAKNPTDENLIRQSSLIHTAMITTIDSFCVFLLRNHFHEIGLDPAFRIADNEELSLVKGQVLSEVLEEAYKEDDEAIKACIAYFNKKVMDQTLYEKIDKLHRFSQSSPFPEKWLDECVKEYLPESEAALAKTAWAKRIIEIAKKYIEDGKRMTGQATMLASSEGGPSKYLGNLEDDTQIFESLLECDTYQKLHEKLAETKFSRLSTKKEEADPELTQQVKDLRDKAKKAVGACQKLFGQTEKEELKLLEASMPVVKGLVMLTKRFASRYLAAKLEKGVIDFADEVHMALSILIDEDGNPTNVAKSYQTYFSEIMIDEYQDSNLVQELLLSSISKQTESTGNRFMVGDIKQSIYRFRLANPEIFLEKYNQYPTSEKEKDIRIDLNQNFRSRWEVLDSVNAIFERIMTEPLGGVVYDQDAELKLGASYPAGNAGEFDTEYLLFERNAQDDKIVCEAEMIAGKIEELLKNGRVSEGGVFRPVKLSDIVILLRSTKDAEHVFRRIFSSHGIAMKTESTTGYFEADEIQSVLSLLSIIENPLDDITLAGVIKSYFGGCDDESLAKLRLIDKEAKLYQNLAVSTVEEHKRLYEKIERYRELSDHMGIRELLTEIFEDHQYEEYVRALPGGSQKQANVEMLMHKAIEFEKTSYHGLFSFVNYIKQLHHYEVDMGQAEVAGEALDAVTLMTIHKSKGLEFPVVFVSCIGKAFNDKDQEDIVMFDMELGIAVDYVDHETCTKVKTTRKRAFAEKEKIAMLGEELRILYVALTRAKEKLIITGCVKEFDEIMQGLLNYDDKLIPFSKLITCKSYLDFILVAMNQKKDVFKRHTSETLSTGKAVKQISLQARREMLEDCLKEEPTELAKQLMGKFSSQYQYAYLSELYAKTSVSELKKAHILEDEEAHVVFETDRVEQPYLPQFMREKSEAGGAMRGSAYHRLLELVDYESLHRLIYDGAETFFTPDENRLWEFVKNEFARISTEGKMSEDMSLVRQDKIGRFLSCESAFRMARAASKGLLFKEQPFVMAISASRVKPGIPEEEKVLIQGIIDVFFYEENASGERTVHVLDYKTDRVDSPAELAKRYEVQLDYYAEALQKLTTYAVKEKIIYSFALERELVL